jgi:hypothetical protein
MFPAEFESSVPASDPHLKLLGYRDPYSDSAPDRIVTIRPNTGTAILGCSTFVSYPLATKS